MSEMKVVENKDPRHLLTIRDDTNEFLLVGGHRPYLSVGSVEGSGAIYALTKKTPLRALGKAIVKATAPPRKKREARNTGER